MSRLSNKTVVDKEQELRPVRFTETGRMRLCFVLRPIDPVTAESLEPTNALYIACEHPPYNDAKLYE